MSVLAFIEDCHASRLPFTPSSIPFNESRNPPPVILISPNLSINFFIPISIPENNPALIISNIGSRLPSLNTDVRALLIFSNAFSISVAAFEEISAKVSIPNDRPSNIPTDAESVMLDIPPVIILKRLVRKPAKGLNTFLIFSIVLLKASEDFNASFIPETKSPMLAVISNIPFPAGRRKPTKSANPLSKALTTSTPKLKIENTPLNVLFNLSAVSSLILNLSLKFFSVSVKLYNCSAVVLGKISRKASCIGLIVSARPLKEFLRASIKFSRPDGIAIFFVNSSRDTVPSFMPCSSSCICLTCSFV